MVAQGTESHTMVSEPYTMAIGRTHAFNEFGRQHNFVTTFGIHRVEIMYASYDNHTACEGNTKMWNLKLYCGYKYTRPCMINNIWGLKQLWLQINGLASFFYRYCWAVRNREGAKNENENIYLQWDSNPLHVTPRQVNQRFRPPRHDALMKICGWMSYRIVGYKFIKPFRDNTCQIDCGYMCIWTECQTNSTFLISNSYMKYANCLQNFAFAIKP